MTTNSLRLLIVEDDPDGQTVTATLLEHLNYPIDVAANAQEAEYHLFGTDNTYAAIIIDLALPDKNGWELLAEIKANPRTTEIPCIAVTAYHTFTMREETISAGFKAYFPKPIDATAFARQLEALL